MANKRNLKKDVDFLVNEVVGDCYAYMYLNGTKNRDEAIQIMESVVDKRNELFDRINNPGENLDPKALKGYYRAIYTDLLSAIDEAFNKISELALKN